METTCSSITVQSTMTELLDRYPGAHRALFRKYHIGGCSSCAFDPAETLDQLCQRNSLNSSEVMAFLHSTHSEDEKILIEPPALARWRHEKPDLPLLDIRSRPEFEAVRIPGSVLLSQATMQEIMSQWPRDTTFVIVDHQGQSGLDAAAYFAGHGFVNVRCLKGGIDAWSREVDKEIRRYRIC